MDIQDNTVNNDTIQLTTSLEVIDDTQDRLNQLMALFEVVQLDEFVTLSEGSRKNLADLMGDLAYELNENITALLDGKRKAV